jgi:hypothetical protein
VTSPAVRRRGRDLEDGRAGWLVCVIGAVAAVVPAASWKIPDYRGIPYPLVFALGGVAALGALYVVRWRGRLRHGSPSRRGLIKPLEALAVLVGVAATLGVVTIVATQPLRDLGVYLRAGDAFARGAPVYLDHLVQSVPTDRSLYPFLYPPPLLPLLALLVALPRPLVDVAVMGGSLAAVVFALRTFGLPWRWVLAAIFTRPVFEGLWVGNVAVPLLACLAIALRHPSALVIPPLAKAYSATASLWLIRERRWRSLALGSAGVAVVVAATLPMTGIDAWWAWLAGLDWFARSQSTLPDYLYGIALQRYVGPAIGLGIGLLVLAAALLARGRDGLGRLGLATPVLSPSVFGHGLLVALPAMGVLRPAILWIALASMAFGTTAGSWIGPAITVAAWVLPDLRRSSADLGRAGVPDPLDGADGAWPGAETG